MILKVPLTIRLDRPVYEALVALAAAPGGSKSRLINDALAAWLAQRGKRDLDVLLQPRLDRLSRSIDQARCDLEVLLESVALFVRYQLIIAPPLPETDSEALAIGRERFESFVAQVRRQIESGARTLDVALATGQA